MALDLTNDKVYELNPGVFCHARNNQADALAKQGKLHTPTVDDADMGWNNGSGAVTYAGAADGHVGKIIYNEQTKTKHKITLRIGGSYTVTPVHTGTTTTIKTNILDSNVATFHPHNMNPWGAQ